MSADYTGGTFTINPSGPGVIAGTTVTATICTATSNVAISISTKSVDAQGGFGLIIVPGSGSFTASCDRTQLTTTLTGNWVLVNTA